MLPQQSATKKGRRNVKGFSRKRKTHERNRLTNLINHNQNKFFFILKKVKQYSTNILNFVYMIEKFE